MRAAGDPPREPRYGVPRPGNHCHAESDQIRRRAGAADVAARGHDGSDL
jgi:hypothetical protein